MPMMFVSPPNQNGLVLNNGDILTVLINGLTDFTTINDGGAEKVTAGLSNHTTINSGGGEDVFVLGTADNTTINGGLLRVAGVSDHTTINGGVEEVQKGGKAQFTKINKGCVGK